jgi:hypothetical protein
MVTVEREGANTVRVSLRVAIVEFDEVVASGEGWKVALEPRRRGIHRCNVGFIGRVRNAHKVAHGVQKRASIQLQCH